MKIRIKNQITKGKVFTASNVEDLQKVFEQIEEEVKKNETR